jgi:hypothetical protein
LSRIKIENDNKVLQIVENNDVTYKTFMENIKITIIINNNIIDANDKIINAPEDQSLIIPISKDLIATNNNIREIMNKYINTSDH